MPVFKEQFSDAVRAADRAVSAAGIAAPQVEDGGFFAFLKGVIDVVNPLHHIPVVGALYRHFAGDAIAPAARIAGDALYGGPLGAAAGFADVALEKATGRDMGATALNFMGATALNFLGGGPENAPAPQPSPPVLLAAADIIWNAQNSQPSHHRPSAPTQVACRTGMEGHGPACTPPAAGPVRLTKGDAPANAERTEFPRRPADSITSLRLQEAPAEAAFGPAPPELIAARMADALDKYAAMKRASF